MAGMTDKDYVATSLDQAFGLAMDLAHQWAGRIEIIEASRFGRRRNQLWHAMGGKYHWAPLRHLVQFLDEYGAHTPQPVDDEAIVYDFVPDIDWRPEPFDCQLDDLDGAIDSRTKAARCRDQDMERGLV
jgi:hypothetical protein